MSYIYIDSRAHRFPEVHVVCDHGYQMMECKEATHTEEEWDYVLEKLGYKMSGTDTPKGDLRGVAL